MTKATSSVLWSEHPDHWELQSEQVEIWRVWLDLSTDPGRPFQTVLSSDEKQRAAAFVFPRDRNRFVLAHGYLRNILARYLHCGPGTLTFSTNDYGKPVLQDHRLEFNLSHSGAYGLIAVSRQCVVGVDVERIRQEMEFEDLARRFFSQREYSELMDVPRDQRSTAFFTCWTLKEAYIKAHGLGLSLPLDSFDVAFVPNEGSVLRATRPDPTEASRWTLLSFEVDSEYTGALAVESRASEISYWNWTAMQG